MSDRDPTGDELQAAHADMLAQKQRGEWDPGKGDIPLRIGPVPIPPGYRTLSDACAKWTALTVSSMPEPDERQRDAVADASVSALLDALVDGRVQSFAVAQDHRLSVIPATVWLHLREDAGGQQNAQTSIVNDCLTGAAFEPHYVGATAVIDDAAYDRIRMPPKVEHSAPSTRPWEAFKSLKAWLSDPVAATRFADALLAAEGVPTCDEPARRRVLLRYLADNGRSITKDSLAAMRRHGDHH